MRAKRPIVPAGIFLFILCPLLPPLASAQQAVGVVTGLQGRVELSRQASPTPVSLRLRDDLFLRDIVDTRRESVARILFGGQSTVTVRELTRLEIRAELLPTGATRSVYNLPDGKVRVTIAPKLMRPGDVIEIHTPNAVATIRGSVLIAEYVSGLGHSLFTLLSGSAIIAPAGQVPFTLGPNSRVTISGALATGTQASPVETVTAAAAAEANQGLQVGLAHTEEAGLGQIAETQLDTATQLATVTVGAPVSPAEEAVTATTPTSTEITKATIGGTSPRPLPPPAPSASLSPPPPIH